MRISIGLDADGLGTGYLQLACTQFELRPAHMFILVKDARNHIVAQQFMTIASLVWQVVA